MKNFLLFIICLMVFSDPGFGQVWVDKGAVWHLDWWAVGPAGLGFYKIEYEKDTLIQGRECQKIITHDYGFGSHSGQVFLLGKWKLPDQFTYVSGDTVFYWHNNDFYVLFNFGAAIGESWVVAVEDPTGISPCDDTSSVIVTDTGRVTINSMSYRYITIEPFSNATVGMKGTYVERFGITDTYYDNFQTLFPYPFECDSLGLIVEWYFFRFKCFQDTSFGLYNPSGGACDSLLQLIGIQEPQVDQISLYPNPTSGLVYIDDPMKMEKIAVLYNYQGALIRRFQLNSDKNNFDISDLPRGVYMVVIRHPHGPGRSYKIIRE